MVQFAAISPNAHFGGKALVPKHATSDARAESASSTSDDYLPNQESLDEPVVTIDRCIQIADGQELQTTIHLSKWDVLRLFFEAYETEASKYQYKLMEPYAGFFKGLFRDWKAKLNYLIKKHTLPTEKVIDPQIGIGKNSISLNTLSKYFTTSELYGNNHRDINHRDIIDEQLIQALKTLSEEGWVAPIDGDEPGEFFSVYRLTPSGFDKAKSHQLPLRSLPRKERDNHRV